MTRSSPLYWEERATELSRTSLETIRESAKAWAASTTALLGVFGTVTVVKGPDSIAKLSGDTRDYVTWLIVVAAVLAFVSVLATAYASRGPTKRYTPLTGLRLKKWTSGQAGKANAGLRVGKITGIAAAVLVLAAGIVATANEADKGSTSSASFLVRTSDGALQCGTLKRTGTALVLEDGSGKQLLDLASGVAEATSVTSCPADAAK